MRTKESPVIVADLQELEKKYVDFFEKVLNKLDQLNPGESNELIDIKEAVKISGRNEKTIRNHCRVIELGVNGKHLFSKKKVEELK